MPTLQFHATIEVFLCSVFAKVYDLVLINKFQEHLITSDLQFGFKRRLSTAMCTMAVSYTHLTLPTILRV